MTEIPHPEAQQPTPQELNRELMGLFQLLPDFSVWDLHPEEMEIDTPRRLLEDAEILDALFEKRNNSKMRTLLRERFQGLIARTFLTDSAQTSLGWEFDEMTLYGIERKAYSEKFRSQLEGYTNLFDWDNPESGGPFDQMLASSIDSKLYQKAVQEMLLSRRIDERLENDPDMDDFKSRIREEGKRMREKEKEMSPQELEAHNALKAKGDKVAFALIDQRNREEALVREWRNDHRARFGDEP